MGNQGKYSDGKSITVIAPAGGLTAGRLARVDGWNGVPVMDAAEGEGVALQVDPTELFYIAVGAAVAAARGAVLYVPPATSGDATSALTATATSNVAAVKVEEAKDANNIIGVRVLNIA